MQIDSSEKTPSQFKGKIWNIFRWIFFSLTLLMALSSLTAKFHWAGVMLLALGALFILPLLDSFWVKLLFFRGQVIRGLSWLFIVFGGIIVGGILTDKAKSRKIADTTQQIHLNSNSNESLSEIRRLLSTGDLTTARELLAQLKATSNPPKEIVTLERELQKMEAAATQVKTKELSAILSLINQNKFSEADQAIAAYSETKPQESDLKKILEYRNLMKKRAELKEGLSEANRKLKEKDFTSALKIADTLLENNGGNKQLIEIKKMASAQIKKAREATKSSIHNWANGIGAFVALIGIGLFSAGKRDGRFKTGFKDNIVPDVTSAWSMIGTAVIILLIGNGIGALYGAIFL